MNQSRSYTDLLRDYKWRILGFLIMLVVSILFLTIGFWKTVLILILTGLGIGIGYAKDRKEEFLIFLDKIR
ncbi:membrane protein [Lysinibacillus alkalisoli]|uniref:Membrane protein n=1 Tax=Lysinibacillus alkalisoli TaxID=1911548 RepID=A0A917LJD4_9BACI|nr:DUF2273 domain-containing protein [Lysinibacillus alkalisoli]GGG30446.1 membrane protein [Lysinibacillus alkalisoli]